jgi:hypothetical protein
MTERLVPDHGAFHWRWALPLVPIAASMFCLSALVYYHTAMGGTGAAWGFFQGAVVLLYRWLGFVPTFMFWLLLFVWCSIWFVTGRWENARTRLLWMGAFTLCVAILVNLGTASDAPPHAGFIGTFVAVRLVSVIGHALAALLAVAASLASLLLATDFLFYRYFEAMARGRGAAEEAGVEPEATDAFRELAFAGVYADEPRAAPAAPAADVAAPADLASSPAAPVQENAAEEPPLVVRPRRRRREGLAAAPPAEAAADATAEAAAETFAPLAAAMPQEESADDARAPDLDPALAARSEVEPPAAGSFSELVEVADGVFEPVPRPSLDTLADPGLEADAPGPDEDADDRPLAPEPSGEPVVEIPRAPAMQGTLFPLPSPAGDLLDRAAREVLASGRASVTLLRRHLRCSAGEALALLDALRAAGVIDGEPGAPHGAVLTTLADWEAR